MKRIFLIVLIISGFTSLTHAQKEIGERLKAIRAEVYTRVLNLTSEEAQNFWPIFNEYVENKENLQKQLKPEGEIDGMSDGEVEEYVKKYFEIRQKEFDLKRIWFRNSAKCFPSGKLPNCPRPSGNSARRS